MELSPPFAVEQLYDVERAAGHRVIARERRRLLLQRADGRRVWAYLRHGHTVVRLEQVRHRDISGAEAERGESVSLLRERLRLVLPAGARVHDALACPGEIWRLDTPAEASWRRAQQAVEEGATPELQLVDLDLAGAAAQLVVEEHWGAVVPWREGEQLTPWALPDEHVLSQRLGRVVASRCIGSLRVSLCGAVGANEGATGQGGASEGAAEPSGVSEGAASRGGARKEHKVDVGLARALLDRAEPGLRQRRSVHSYLSLGRLGHGHITLPDGYVARMLHEGEVWLLQLMPADPKAPLARLSLYLLRSEALHLPYVAPRGEPESSRLLGQQLSWRRDEQRGRVVRDAVLSMAGGLCLYLVSEIEGEYGSESAASAWLAHTKALDSLQAQPSTEPAPEQQTQDWDSLYTFTDRLGSGGAGEVYRVTHNGWRMDLAVKRPREIQDSNHAESSMVFSDLSHEAEAWAQLAPHPNVVSCYQVRSRNGVPHIFVELMSGGSLAEWIADGRLYQPRGNPADYGSAEVHQRASAFARIADIGIQMAYGLHHAHAHGLIHQDVKPANVMLSPQGVAKVTDFGLVKALPSRREIELHGTLVTTYGGLTPAYCSPEQARAAAGEPIKLTRRTDIWSWAVVILQMLNGAVSWRSGASAHLVLPELLAHGPAEPLAPPLPAALAELLRRCLQPDPQARPHDLLEVASEVARIHHQTLGNRYPRPAPQPADGRADVCNNRGVSLMDLQQPDAAAAAWRQALELEPLHLQASYNLALYQHRRGSAELAHRMTDVQHAHPHRWQAHYASAWAHIERGDAEAARLALDEARQRRGPARELANAAEAMTPGLEPVRESPIIHHDEPITEGDLFSRHNEPLAESDIFSRHDEPLTESDLFSCDGDLNSTATLSLDTDKELVLLQAGTPPRCIDAFEIAEPLCGRLHGAKVSIATRTALLRWQLPLRRTRVLRRGHGKVTLDRNGTRAVEAMESGRLRLWDLDAGRIVTELCPYPVEIEALMLDGTSLTVRYDDGALRVYHLQPTIQAPWLLAQPRSSEQLLQDEAHFGDIITRTETALAEGDREAANRWLAQARNIAGYQRSEQLEALQRKLASNTRRGPATRCMLRRLISTKGWRQVALSHDGTQALCLDASSQPALWQLESGQLLDRLHTPEPLREVALSSDGTRALTHAQSGQLLYWMVRDDRASLLGHGDACALSAGGDHALLLRNDTVQLLKLPDGAQTPLPLPAADVCCMALSEDGEYALLGYRDGALRLCSTTMPRQLWHQATHLGPITAVALSQTGTALSASLWQVPEANTSHEHSSHGIICYDLLTGHERHRLPSPAVSSPSRLGISADGSLAWYSDGQYPALLWELSDGTIAHRLDPATDVALSADASRAVSCSPTGLRLWELSWQRLP